MLYVWLVRTKGVSMAATASRVFARLVEGEGGILYSSKTCASVISRSYQTRLPQTPCTTSKPRVVGFSVESKNRGRSSTLLLLSFSMAHRAPRIYLVFSSRVSGVEREAGAEREKTQILVGWRGTKRAPSFLLFRPQG